MLVSKFGGGRNGSGFYTVEPEDHGILRANECEHH